jgi:phosphinothricin acetyltransferase
MRPADWPAVARIYELGLAQGTLETRVPSREAFEASKLEPLRLVATLPDAALPAGQGAVLGWVAAGRVSSRPVYAGVVEHSVYVDPAARGRGVGRALLEALVTASELHGVWSIRSGLFPENAASRALHARCGFREVGRYDRPGRRDGVWHDVVVVERRSRTVGVDGEPLVRLALPEEAGTAWRTWVVDAPTAGVLLGRAAVDRIDPIDPIATAPAYVLRELSVGAAHRGRGLGRRLLATVLAAVALDAPGPAAVLLPAGVGAADAARLGFRPPGPGEDLPDGPGHGGYLRIVGN